MYRKEIKVLDCTIRDGGLMNNHLFSDDLVRRVFQAVNKSGDIISNVKRDNVNVVTWGGFPGEKIKQPTIVDARSFMIWKDEAFSLWINDWASIYEKDSISYSIINNIYENYFLVNIVDNDFISSNMIKQLLEK